ncbi:MAG: SRPBCC family protein [Chitinophagaceae bacterium]
MKIIRLAIISIVSLFLVVLVISLFIPSHVRISRAREIAAPLDSVRVLLVEPTQWKRWYPNLDSAQLYTENGQVKGVFSETNGYRKLVLDSVSGTTIKTLYTVEGREPLWSGWTLIPTGAAKKMVTVQWYMDFELRWYPWEKFASLVFEKTYGPMMETGLTNLENIAENNHPTQIN